ncbi:MAG: SirB2 family protein [Pseudomonadales bacterium]|nr:SirB2 family protein [Pseudomonadales bacterium]
MYTGLHHLHMTCAVLSVGFFVIRGIWMMLDHPALQAKFTRIAPHVIDTFLLASAVGLMFVIGQYPGIDHWLTVKLVALLVYIALGMVAIKRGKTKSQRIIAFFAALVVFGFILSVAITRQPTGFLHSLM